jgi:formylglycine-generating enzyme required for sulfatase activity
VIRGGAFNHDRTLAQTFYAVRHKPSFRSRNIGFRVAWDAE